MWDIIERIMRKPAPVVRFYAATRRESRSVQQKAADKLLELEIMRVHMTDEQAEAARFRGMRTADEIAAARETWRNKRKNSIRRRAKRSPSIDRESEVGR